MKRCSFYCLEIDQGVGDLLVKELLIYLIDEKSLCLWKVKHKEGGKLKKTKRRAIDCSSFLYVVLY